MPSGDIYELCVDQTMDGQSICNTYHFLQVGSDGSGDARQAINDIWIYLLEPSYRAAICDSVDIVQARVRRLHPTQTQTLIYSIGTQGGIVTENHPAQTCAILRQHATPLGRRGTGHVKISGVPIANVKNGRIDQAYQVLLDAFGTLLESDQTDAVSGYTMRASVYSNVDQVARAIVNTNALGRVKTVYSRQIGVGQ